MDVTLAAHRYSVAEALGDRLSRADYVLPGLGLRMEFTGLTKRGTGEDGSRPRAEILGAEFLSRNLAQIIIHIARVDRSPFAVIIDVLKQLVAGQVANSPHDLCEMGIIDTDCMALSALAAKIEVNL